MASYGSIPVSQEWHDDNEKPITNSTAGGRTRCLPLSLGRGAMLAVAAAFGLAAFFLSTRHLGYTRVAWDHKQGQGGLFFKEQMIDHYNEGMGVFQQRYYEKIDHFEGPGSPVFVILGGEDPLEGLLYPFVYDHLALEYGGYAAALEHRFFGESMPLTNPTNADLHHLLAVRQALLDIVRFVEYKTNELGCSRDRSSPDYCPVITVGGSYPGFLSALMRFNHSDVVDISYASSAPFNLYSHHLYPGAYYEFVTMMAENASPGCADAVRSALLDAQATLVNSHDDRLGEAAADVGICHGTIPKYIQSTKLFSRELMLVIATHFANYNMDYYPPGPDQDLYKACQIFQDEDLTPAAKVRAFLLLDDKDSDCFDLMTEQPPGPNATISASDWSGVGAGPEGFYWEYISCQLLPQTGLSDASMFPPRKWTWEWETEHCMSRFDWKPSPQALEQEFGFDDRSKVTRLLLTNGKVDGWSIASVMQEDAPGIRVVNMVNGAHHSDLSHQGPTDRDTWDVKEAFKRISMILGDWLDEVRAEGKRGH